MNIVPGCKKKERHPFLTSRLPSWGLNSASLGFSTTQYSPCFSI